MKSKTTMRTLHDNPEMFAAFHRIQEMRRDFPATSLISQFRRQRRFSPKQALLIMTCAKKAKVYVSFKALRIDLRTPAHTQQIMDFSPAQRYALWPALSKKQRDWLTQRTAVAKQKTSA